MHNGKPSQGQAESFCKNLRSTLSRTIFARSVWLTKTVCMSLTIKFLMYCRIYRYNNPFGSNTVGLIS